MDLSLSVLLEVLSIATRNLPLFIAVGTKISLFSCWSCCCCCCCACGQIIVHRYANSHFLSETSEETEGSELLNSFKVSDVVSAAPQDDAEYWGTLMKVRVVHHVKAADDVHP